MDFKEQLRAQVDIVRVASDYVRLRRVGNRYSGLCPFHNEKTPSFSISAGASVFQMLRLRREGRCFQFRDDDRGPHVLGSAQEACRSARHRAAEAIPRERRRNPAAGRALRNARDRGRAFPRESGRARTATSVRRAYIAKRGVGEASVQQFGLGLADGSGRALAAGSGSNADSNPNNWKSPDWWASATTARSTTGFATG